MSDIQQVKQKQTQNTERSLINIISRPVEESAGAIKTMSSEMFFAFPHHLSQIIEEEERQSSRHSDEVLVEVSHVEEHDVSHEDSRDEENSNCPTKETNIGEKEKEKVKVEKSEDGNNNKENEEDKVDVKEVTDEDSDGSIKNKRKISRM